VLELRRKVEERDGEIERLQRARIGDSEIIGRWQREAERLTDERDRLTANMSRSSVEIERENFRLREALGDLGIAADKVHKELAIIQPFLDVFKKHGKLITECMEAKS